MQDALNQNPQFIKKIVFSDDATFSLNGSVNRQNSRFLSLENPHWIGEAHTQHPQKKECMGWDHWRQNNRAFFFRWKPQRCKEFKILPEWAFTRSCQYFSEVTQTCQISQYGFNMMEHLRTMREFLDNAFPERWIGIGRRGPIEWLARSPDLAPLDFFLWGYLKSKDLKTEYGSR